jgi:hypothetical protein
MVADILIAIVLVALAVAGCAAVAAGLFCGSLIWRYAKEVLDAHRARLG